MTLHIDPPPLEITIPAHVVSETNLRGAWYVLAQRRALHRNGAKMAVSAALRSAPPSARGLLPALVTLTRIRTARGKVLDDDNLAAGFKAIRDGVADGLGVNDGDRTRVRWKYAEERGEEWAVRIRIEKREP
jgi:hypothetical protein